MPEARSGGVSIHYEPYQIRQFLAEKYHFEA